MIYAPSAKLDTVSAKNFTMREVARSQIATRNGIDNIPPPHVLARARTLAMLILQPIRMHFGRPFSPNSWYRCEEVEKILCRQSFIKWAARKGMDPDTNGTWRSYFERKQHPTGMAADIEVPGMSNDDLFEWIKKNLTYDQLIREFPRKGHPMSGWVHVSYNPEGNRQQAFTIG